MMAFNRPVIVALAALWSTLAAAQQDDWRKYVVVETGANVDVPRSIFSKEARKPETGYGTRFLTADGRANLTVQSVPNDANFFFSSRRRHTRSDRDWSSDVCYSDLPSNRLPDRHAHRTPRPSRRCSRAETH